MRFFLVIGLVLVSACIVVAGGAVHIRYKARILLEDIKCLDTNIDSSSLFDAFREKHRYQLANAECRNDLCQYQFVVSNSVLSSVHLTPRAELRATITMFHGKLDAAGVEYMSAIRKQNNPIVHVQEDFCGDRTDIRCDHFALNPHGRNVTPTWNGIIEFGELATDEQKRAAWSINLDCLVSRLGCTDISQLSPAIWKATGIGVVSSRMRSTADSSAESSQPLSD